jgi:hypothetical protein
MQEPHLFALTVSLLAFLATGRERRRSLMQEAIQLLLLHPLSFSRACAGTKELRFSADPLQI